MTTARGLEHTPLRPPPVSQVGTSRNSVMNDGSHVDVTESCDASPAVARPIESEPLLQTRSRVRVLVDDRERLRDVEPRGIVERIAFGVKSQHAIVSRHRLRFGDFIWVADAAGNGDADCPVLGCVVERKRIADLVGRSAVGAHVRQLERLESCGLPHPFLLIEGEQRQAAACTVYDEDSVRAAAEAERFGGGGGGTAIRCAEDIDELCARHLVTQSRVGVISTRDVEGTVRVLALLTTWLVWKTTTESTDARTCPCPTLATCQESEAATAQISLGASLRSFEADAEWRAEAREELAVRLSFAGVTDEAVASVCKRFCSAADARTALLSTSCAVPACRGLLFDCLAGCGNERIGEQICAALGVAIGPPTPPEPSAAAIEPSPPQIWRRSVTVSASRGLLRRLGNPEDSDSVRFQEADDARLWPQLAREGGFGCMMVVEAELAAPAPSRGAFVEMIAEAGEEASEDGPARLRNGHVDSCRRRSAAVLVCVLPGAVLVREVLRVAARLGAATPTPVLSDATAKVLAITLAGGPHCSDTDSVANARAAGVCAAATSAAAARSSPSLVVLEGLRAAVLAKARQAACGDRQLQQLLPRLLEVAELTALALDLRGGWRVRFHETRASWATGRFLRTMTRVMLEEAMLPFFDTSETAGGFTPRNEDSI
eukprot:TRINITY_DN25628_c1_g2_i1.p1 TRINITY_DN25628_c1_g2~~TRINITY_DN25628_c1_g2_i1.p1  ORF type:complete len:661 (+),score=95.92 TRINITY_DN25628_c1_g2_i1:1502-3484(+)